MKLHTTVIGSYPAVGSDPDESRKRAVDDQLKADIDFISDGQVRAGMRELFLNDLKGITKESKKFVVSGELKREESIAVEDLISSIEYVGNPSRFKGILTGPLTLAYGMEILESAPYNSSLPYPDQNLLWNLAQAQRWIINEYEKLGLSYIQIDEPTLGMVGPWKPALEILEDLFTQIDTPTVLHVCGKLKMDLFEEISKLKGLDFLALEFAGSPKNLGLLASEIFLNSDKKLSFGCVDSKNRDIEDPAKIYELIKEAPKDKIALINPDCGLRNLERNVSFEKLKNLSQAKKILEETRDDYSDRI